MDPVLALEEASKLRVLVLPVGPVAPEKLERFAGIVRSFSFVPVLALDRIRKDDKSSKDKDKCASPRSLGWNL